MDDKLIIDWLNFYSTPWQYAHRSWLPLWLSSSLNNTPSLRTIRHDLYQYFSISTDDRLSFPKFIEPYYFISFNMRHRTLYDALLRQTLLGENEQLLSSAQVKWCYGLSLSVRSGDIIHYLASYSVPERVANIICQHWFFHSEPKHWGRLKLLFPKNEVMQYATLPPLPKAVHHQVERLCRAITNKVASNV